jgi:predicted nucleotidyltransferase
VRSFGVALIR